MKKKKHIMERVLEWNVLAFHGADHLGNANLFVTAANRGAKVTVCCALEKEMASGPHTTLNGVFLSGLVLMKLLIRLPPDCPKHLHEQAQEQSARVCFAP